MDAVSDTQPPDGPELGSAEIIDFEACRRARGLAPVRSLAEATDPFPWAYTFELCRDRL
jgi:hypothetical protein